MAIVKMKRLRLIALDADRAALFSAMQRLGCVEIGETEARLSSPDWASLLRRDSSSLGDVKTKLSMVTHALEALRKYAPVKSGLFVKRADISEAEFFDPEALAASLAIAQSISDSLAEITRCNTQENRLEAARAALRPWLSLEQPLSSLSTEHVRLVLGVCPLAADLAKLSAQLQETAPLSQIERLSEDREQYYLLAIYHRDEAEKVEAILKSFAFSATAFKEQNGTAADEIAAIERTLQEVALTRKAAEENIVALAPQRKDLQFCLDRLNQHLAREAARERLLTDGTAFFLEGWVADTGSAAVQALLDSHTCAYAMEEASKEETPPTLLKNPRWLRCMNMVTEMYSLPAYHGGIDPNPLIFGFFILFFGFMFADIGYGIILFTLSLIITKKYHPKKTIGYMFELGIYLGISTFLFGIITGGFFGDAITVFQQNVLGIADPFELPYLINPLKDPMTVLVIAIVLGVVQLICGQLVHLYMKFRDKEGLDGLLDVLPWWLLFGGIALMVLQGTALGIWIGVAALVLTQGRHKKGIFGKAFGGIASLYDVTSWLSDVLSYCRLMALMLATSVIASVMNILGSLPGSIVAFVIIFVIGHVFNIGVNIIGTYVHAARLQYLEYFSKFYKDGGIPFRPLSYQTKFTDITDTK